MISTNVFIALAATEIIPKGGQIRSGAVDQVVREGSRVSEKAEKGQTMTEYALILAAVAVVVFNLGTSSTRRRIEELRS